MRLPKRIGYRSLSKLLANPQIKLEVLARELDRRRIPYITFSKVNCLGFCSYRYVLEYVKLRRLHPEPTYFVKGRLFHQAAANYYEAKRSGAVAVTATLPLSAAKHLVDEDRVQVSNALQLLAQNTFTGWEVVAVESPFILYLGPRLPPCLGIVDLVLRKGRQFAVVDHKTGKNFNSPDPLQLAIYQEYVGRKYKPWKCIAIYDQYRWVHNLDRIRKPAFKRTTRRLGRDPWKKALRRIASAHKTMRDIERERDATADGPCYMCPYQRVCPKATTGFFSYY
jgi:hypothetical protein